MTITSTLSYPVVESPVKRQPEAALDEALSRALIGNPTFAAWFLSRTAFKSDAGSCVFCRCDNPWGNVRFRVPNAGTTEGEAVMQCETDVLAVFATDDGRRLALHIENKLTGGSFTNHQPEMYQARKDQWKGRAKLGGYTHATAVLIAPIEFYRRLSDRATIFDAYISHEDISKYIPEFGAPTPLTCGASATASIKV